MTIVVNAVSAKSGGAFVYICNLIQALTGTSGEAKYVFFVPKIVAESLPQLDGRVEIKMTDVGHRASWARYVWDQVVLRWIIKRNGYDLLLSSSDFGMLAAPCPQIVMVRNNLYFSPLYIKHLLPQKRWRFKVQFYMRRWLVIRSVKSADAVVTASKSMLDDMAACTDIPKNKAAVINYGVPLNKFPALAVRPHQEREVQLGRIVKLLFVSEYSDYKNLTTLLKAVLILRGQEDNVRLVTTADPEQFPEADISSRDEDRRLAAHLLVSSCVDFTGPVAYREISALYAQSHIFVFPSLAESFGHPLVEAMASGLPIIASDIPICREICGDAAIYFDPTDPYDLADKISMLKNNSELQRQLGEIGRKRAEAQFDWEDHVRRLVSVIEHLARTERRQ
ncbi:MAG: glycosyltransferase family 1 protein [Nitrospirota bacterium]